MKKIISLFLMAILFVFSGCRIGDDPTTLVGGGDGNYVLEMTTPNTTVSSGEQVFFTVSLTKVNGTNVSYVKNAEVEFFMDGNTDGAKIEPAKNFTSETGETYTKFTAELPEGVTSRSYTVIAKYLTVSDTVEIDVSADYVPPNTVQLKITASPFRINADGSGTSASVITAILTDENNVAASGQKIVFKTTSGTIVPIQTITNESGAASVSLVSEPRNVMALVTAQLESDPKITANFEVEFFGVTLELGKNKESIVPDGKDTVIFTARVLDASKNPVIKEPIVFKSLDANTFEIVGQDNNTNITTNTSGEAMVKVVGTGVGKEFETLVASAAGAKDTITINYSSKFIVVDTAGFDNNYTVNLSGSNENVTSFTITYLDNDKVTPIVDADVEVSIDRGGFVNGDAAPLLRIASKTDANGKCLLTFVNPDYVGDAEITISAKKDGEVTGLVYMIYIKSGELARLDIKSSRSMVGVGGDEIDITVTAYDGSNQKCAFEMIDFEIVTAPGGNERLSPSSKETNKSGEAIIKFISGSLESSPDGVKIVGHASGITTDTVKLTITNLITGIAIAYDNVVTKRDGVYLIKIPATLQNSNTNIVPDGIPVYFSARFYGWWIYERVAVVSSDWKTYSMGYDSTFLQYDDNNHDGVRQQGEGTLPVGTYPFLRGEQIAMFEGDMSFNPGKPFADINGNGVRDYMFIDGGDTITNDKYESPEPWWSKSLIEGRCACEFPKDITGLLPGVYDGVPVGFMDYNGNGGLDVSEPLYIPGTKMIDISSNSDAALKAYYESAPGTINNGAPDWDLFVGRGNYKDKDWNANGTADPTPSGNATPIDPEIKTFDAQATAVLRYSWTDAWRLSVEVRAEAQGVKSDWVKVQNMLPIAESDARYFNPFEGKGNLW